MLKINSSEPGQMIKGRNSDLDKERASEKE